MPGQKLVLSKSRRVRTTYIWPHGMLTAFFLMVSQLVPLNARASNIDKTMSPENAQQSIAELLRRADLDGVLPIQDAHADHHELSYSVRRENGGTRSAAFEAMKYLADPTRHANQGKKHFCVNLPEVRDDVPCWESEADAQRFVAAMNRMIWEHTPEAKAESEATSQMVRQQIAAWRANGSRAVLPEGAERHKVLAEEAIREKNLQQAVNEYTAALEIYLTWPEGQYNLALIFGELNRYSEAIQHMQVYLQLTPDAPDAQRAKEQMWIWQDKQKRGAD